MPVRAVFASAPPEAGMYESFYLRAVSPERPLGVWIRCTAQKAPSHAARGAVWCTVFDLAEPAPFMHKTREATLTVPQGGWIAAGEARIGPGVAEGRSGPAGWSLRWSSSEPELRHLGSGLIYRSPIPRTKLTSPAPAASFDGTLQAGERTIELDGWRGMVGHNWGAEHAERWIWLHGICFEEDPDAWLDVAIGRILIGGRLSPWVANGCLHAGGRRMRLGGLLARGLRVAERPERCSLQIPGEQGLSLEAHVEAPPHGIAGWRYADPDGGSHDVLNCSVAALRLVLRRRGEGALSLHSPHGAAYELGCRERDHGIQIAPFPDG